MVLSIITRPRCQTLHGHQFMTVHNEGLCFYRCLSVHRGAWSQGGACSRRGLLLGGLVSQHALRQTPPGETATAADGKHPTGMHSCLDFMYNLLIRYARVLVDSKGVCESCAPVLELEFRNCF